MSETANKIPNTTVIKLGHDTVRAHLPQLAEVLQVCINNEASSLGFLAPLTQYKAKRYWRNVSEQLTQQQLLLFILVPITDNFPTLIYGTVQLQSVAKATHSHRAEVSKLLVRPDQRMKGYATTLMNVAESTARMLGKELITLDTATETGAMEFYRKLGYEEWGTCQNYASWSDGTRCDATFFRKALKGEAEASGKEGDVGVGDPPQAIYSQNIMDLGEGNEEEGHLRIKNPLVSKELIDFEGGNEVEETEGEVDARVEDQLQAIVPQTMNNSQGLEQSGYTV